MPPSSDTLIISQIRKGDMLQVEGFLERHPEVARSPRLMVEAGRGANLVLLQMLRQLGADVNASWRGYRPLHALLQEEPHPNRFDPIPQGFRRMECLDWLLKNGADPELSGAFPPARAILIAAFAGQPVCFDRIRNAGAVVDGFVSAATADGDAVERLLAEEAGFVSARDNGGLMALHCALATRIVEPGKRLGMVKLLLDAGADPNAKVKGWSHELDPSYFAADVGSLELLLERGADPLPALVSTVWNKRFELAERAIAHGARPDRATDSDKPLLNQMIRWGQVEPALWLLEHGADPNLPDDRGWTAVHQAASRGNERMMRAVLAHGGDLKRKDHEGRLPLHIARMLKRRNLAKLLL